MWIRLSMAYPYASATGIIERYNPGRFLKLHALYFMEGAPVFIFTKTATGEGKLSKLREYFEQLYPVAVVDSLQIFERAFNQYDSANTFFILDNLQGLASFDVERVESFIGSKNIALVASITGSNKSFSHMIFKKPL